MVIIEKNIIRKLFKTKAKVKGNNVRRNKMFNQINS